MTETTELDALRAELDALRAEVALLKATQMPPVIHHHYSPVMPPPAPAKPPWQTVVYPGTAGITMTIPAWTNACAGGAMPPLTWITNAACADQKVYYDAVKMTAGCAGGYAGQVYTVNIPA